MVAYMKSYAPQLITCCGVGRKHALSLLAPLAPRHQHFTAYQLLPKLHISTNYSAVGKMFIRPLSQPGAGSTSLIPIRIQGTLQKVKISTLYNEKTRQITELECVKDRLDNCFKSW
jgi:hypothetical protein